MDTLPVGKDQDSESKDLPRAMINHVCVYVHVYNSFPFRNTCTVQLGGGQN